MNLPVAIVGGALGQSTVHTSVLVGLEPQPIRVEVASTRGPAFYQIVGLAEASVREARVRVASALARLEVLLDEYAITISLSPADLKKSGASLDLALALGVLEAIGKVPSGTCASLLVLGELSLDGQLYPVRGVLPQLLGAEARGLSGAIVPAHNAREAGLVTGIPVWVASTLESVVEHLHGRTSLATAPNTPFAPNLGTEPARDLKYVIGQASARRALEIAAAGGHNLLMLGPPGGGKTMLARALPSILPPLSFEEAIEVTGIHSVAGLVRHEKGIVDERPFRAPHHSVSEAGLVGGGDLPRPGELSLAHRGVLFLDELPEFRRSVLEALRQPLEDGGVSIARVRARAWFPARPMVVAAMNPCPCGYLGQVRPRCTCTERSVTSYRSRISGPLLDRLDVHVSLPPVEVRALTHSAIAEDSAAVRERVVAARERQRERKRNGVTRGLSNAELDPADFHRVVVLDEESRRFLEAAVAQLGLSARAFGKVMRVARTIADLEEADAVRVTHVAEAVQARVMDRAHAA